MGGDDAPGVIVDGALEAIGKERIELVLVGPSDRLDRELSERDVSSGGIEVVEAPEVIGMRESPAQAVKQKKRSSIHVGLQLQKQGEVDAFVSAGNTGAIMAASLFILGRISNVLRPTVIGFFPTLEGTAVVLDIGANVDCRAEHLLQFARMGSLYVEHVLEQEAPTVGLLNVGEEPGKGNEAVKEAYGRMESEEALDFVGNVEGDDVMHHAADVVVCDGFVGNILLKFGESLPDIFGRVVEREIREAGLGDDDRKRIGQLLRRARRRFNYEEYGGAPLLGVDGNVFVGHGCSTPRAVTQLVHSAAEAVRHDMTQVITSAFSE